MLILRAGYRLVILGGHELGRRLVRRAELLGGELIETDPYVRGRYKQVRAVVLFHIDKDLGRALLEEDDATADLRDAGDLRNLCSHLANLGYSFGLFGQYERAEASGREAIEIAQRLQLESVAALAYHNLGYALAGRHRYAEALPFEERAVQWFSERGDVRISAGSRIYLADILLGLDEPARAEAEAPTAVEALHAVPSLRGYAIAMLARTLLVRGKAHESLRAAEEGMAILEELGDIEDGDFLLRLVHAEGLMATERRNEARVALARTLALLRERAAAIQVPRLREGYLTQVPPHARILQLAGEWGID